MRSIARRGVPVLLAFVILGGVASAAHSVDAASSDGEAIAVDVKKPAFIVTSKSGLAKVLKNGEEAKVVALADRYGDICDIDEILSSEYAATRSAILADPKKYIATIDEIIKKKFSTSSYSCILFLGGQDVVPMAELPNPMLRLRNENGDLIDEDTLYTDDVYGDFDGDTIPDVPVARLPDGKSFATMEGQLRGTSAPSSGAMELYNKPWTGAKAIGLQIKASRIDSVAPTKDAKLDANLKYYYFIIHGSKDKGVWSGEGKNALGWTLSVDGLLAQDAVARGIVVSSACYAAYMINETSAKDIGLHFMESGARAYIGATGLNYAFVPLWDPQACLGTTSGRMASLIFSNCELGQDPLLAYFNAKREFARGLTDGDSYNHKILHETNYFGLPFTADSSAGTPAPEPSPSASSGESDTVLAMDVSPSMLDPMSGGVKLDIAKSAADGIVSMIRDESLTQSGSNAIGLVSFASEAQVEQTLGVDYAAASKAIAAMTTKSSTNIGDGLEEALGSLYSSAKTRSRMIILLSDGQSNTGLSADEILSGPVFTAAAAGIKIYTIGFGDTGDIDEDLLRQIANRTGGVYYYADQAFKLENIYIALQHKAGGAILGDYTGTTQAAARQVGAFSVDAVTGELHGTLNTDGGKAQVVLKDPDGRAIDSDYPGAILFQDSKPASVVVKNPQPGVWKAYVESAGGSKVSYDVIVSARGTREPVSTYRTLLALVALGATLLSLGLVAVFRWPIRSEKN